MQLPPFLRHLRIVTRDGTQDTKFADWLVELWQAVNQLIGGLVDTLTVDGDASVGDDLTVGGEIYERGRSVAIGEWTTPAFAAGDFTSTGGGTAWSVDAGDVITYAYTLVGNTMTVAVEIETTDVTGAPTTLNIAIPGGFTATKRMRNPIHVLDAGTAAIGLALVVAGGSVIQCFTSAAAAAWTATTGDNTYVLGEITFEVTPP